MKLVGSTCLVPSIFTAHENELKNDRPAVKTQVELVELAKKPGQLTLHVCPVHYQEVASALRIDRPVLGASVCEGQ